MAFLSFIYATQLERDEGKLLSIDEIFERVADSRKYNKRIMAQYDGSAESKMRFQQYEKKIREIIKARFLAPKQKWKLDKMKVSNKE